MSYRTGAGYGRSKPQTVDKGESQILAMELNRLSHLLSAKSQESAASLVAGFEKYGSLTIGQANFARSLIEQANKAAQPVATNFRPQIGDFSKMIAIFETAASKMKKTPTITFNLPNIGEVKLWVSGSASKDPGTISVASPGGFGNNTWYGRIKKDGTFEASKNATEELIGYLTRFAQDPAGAASKYGRKTSRCCFCNITIRTKESLAVGYGPICADNFGLPWGVCEEV